MHLVARISVIAIVFVIEGVVLSFTIRGVPLNPTDVRAAGAIHAIHSIQGLLFRFVIAFGSSLAILLVAPRKGLFVELARIEVDAPVKVHWLIVHVALLALLLGVSAYIGGGLERIPFVALAIVRPLLALGAGLALFVALAPARVWWSAISKDRRVLAYAAVMAGGVVLAVNLSQFLWAPTARLTFSLVGGLLRPFYPALHIDVASLSLTTDRFGIIIADYCSGLEGVGLMLVFCTAWLWYFRRDYQFPRALLIVPAALLIIFGLNAVRIAALLMIGDSGFPGIASAGFHTQAGWIAFNTSAFAITVISKRSRWLSREPIAASGPVPTDTANPVTPYLLPLLTILVTGMLTRALSAGFDTLYPLKFAAGLTMLWIYRSRYRRLGWRISGYAAGVGIVVFIVWIIAARFLTVPQGKPEALSTLSAASQWLWITTRAAAAVCTVPIAEELAYRGYLMRRLTRMDFEAVAFPEVRWPALALAAVAFGLVHGTLWLPGVLAGLAYGALAVKTGRLGDAVVAHAVTNGSLACYVLTFDQWQLW